MFEGFVPIGETSVDEPYSGSCRCIFTGVVVHRAAANRMMTLVAGSDKEGDMVRLTPSTRPLDPAPAPRLTQYSALRSESQCCLPRKASTPIAQRTIRTSSPP